jgi:PBP1b-binding outer membrane lipoprotein LpoB
MRGGLVVALLFAVMLSGCLGESSPVASVTAQQEEADRAACRSEGQQANANSADGAYDLVRNMVSDSRATAVEQRCMTQRGYKEEQPQPQSFRKGIFQ